MLFKINDEQFDNPSPEFLESQLQNCASKFPNEKYQIIYVDPPWPYNNAEFSAGGVPYPIMSLNDLKRLPIPRIADKPAVLLMWTTGPFLPAALELIKDWGFQYKTIFKYWRKVTSTGKPVSNVGWWTMSSMELLLVATNGPLIKTWKECTLPQEFTGQRQQHSEKPDEIRREICRFFGKKKRIELFARHTNSYFGDSWGLEVPGFFWRAEQREDEYDLVDSPLEELQPLEPEETTPLLEIPKKRKRNACDTCRKRKKRCLH